MKLKEFLIRNYGINEDRATALIDSGLIKVNGSYVKENIELQPSDSIEFNKKLLSFGFEFFDLLKLSGKHQDVFKNLNSVRFVQSNLTEEEFFRLGGFDLVKEGGDLLYVSNIYPLEIRNHLNNKSKKSRVVLVKYTNNYEEFKFKKEILDELLKIEGYALVDVFLSLYSYNQYVLYKRRER